MPRQVLFVQGAGEGTYEDWDSKLARSLARALGDAYAVVYPRMPDEAQPRYPAWRDALLREWQALDGRAASAGAARGGPVLVGHSFGGAVLIRALAERPPRRAPGAIVLIAAPFFGEGGWRSDEMAAPADLGRRLPAGVPVLLYHGSADEVVPLAHVRRYAQAIGQASVRELAGRDHQLGEDLGEVARDIRDALGDGRGGRPRDGR